MSKMDGLRAMREARYERSLTQATLRGDAPVSNTRPAPAPPRPATEPSTSTAEGLCGHRAISGRTCTRERGHDEKSHRYS
jgi:hypothetical protein